MSPYSVSYRSRGALLVYGDAQRLQIALSSLPEGVRILAIAADSVQGLVSKAVLPGRVIQLRGHLGCFRATVAGPEQPLDLAPLSPNQDGLFDLVLDLYPQPLIDREVLPLGYVQGEEEPQALEKQIGALIRLHRPCYIQFDSRAGRSPAGEQLRCLWHGRLVLRPRLGGFAPDPAAFQGTPAHDAARDSVPQVHCGRLSRVPSAFKPQTVCNADAVFPAVPSRRWLCNRNGTLLCSRPIGESSSRTMNPSAASAVAHPSPPCPPSAQHEPCASPSPVSGSGPPPAAHVPRLPSEGDLAAAG